MSDIVRTEEATIEHVIETQRKPSTQEKLLGILDEIELIYKSLLELLICIPGLALDPSISQTLQSLNVSAPASLSSLDPSDFHFHFRRIFAEIVSLLVQRQEEYNALVAQASEEAQIETNIQALTVESEKLKEQVMVIFSKLKDAEQILSNALHAAKQKKDNVRAAEKANLHLDDIVRYAHRISVGFSAAAPTNWMPGDPRRPYPTDVEMRAGIMARMGGNIPPPPNQIMGLPTENLSSTTQRYLASNAGPFTFSPQPVSQIPGEGPKASVTSNLPRDAVEEQDVETMSSDSSQSSDSDEE